MTLQIAATGSLSADDEFNVQWQDPEEAKVCWVWDPSHFPYPFTPLGVDCGRLGANAVHVAMGVPDDEHPPMRFINGYWYWNQVAEGQPSVERRRQIIEESNDPWGTWKGVWEPEIRSLLDPIKTEDLASVPDTDIADSLGRLFADSGTAWGVTMAAAQIMDAAAVPFMKYCRTEFGEDFFLLASTMLSGHSNYSTQSDLAIWKLARTIRDTSDPEQAITELERDPESTDTEAGMLANQFLDHYGWRSFLWSDMVTPVWRVDPTPFFELLRQYVEKLPEDPRVATRRAAQRRRRIAAQVRKNLSGKELKHFDDLLETASIYVRLREARAFWQVAALGVLGVPCRAAGARLVEAGVIDAVDDVFYLHLDDICEATDDPGSEKWTRLVAKRKTAYAKYRNTVPPLTVGAPFDGEVRQLQVQKGKFSGADSDQAADAGKRVIHGTAASRGTVCATARLIYSLDEAERLKEGEILICRTSSPPWTPLIARSAGVIAETGGVLMHCAIVTREYAIPCVVGVGPIDGRIKDGDTITIDGTQGIIRIE